MTEPIGQFDPERPPLPTENRPIHRAIGITQQWYVEDVLPEVGHGGLGVGELLTRARPILEPQYEQQMFDLPTGQAIKAQLLCCLLVSKYGMGTTPDQITPQEIQNNWDTFSMSELLSGAYHNMVSRVR